MPYLRLTCPDLPANRRQTIARVLTEAIDKLLFDPRAGISPDDLRRRTTVHFLPYGPAELFIGDEAAEADTAPDITLELSDWGMSVRQRRRLASQLTPVVAGLFDMPREKWDSINVRFHPYRLTEFAVGGRLLSDLVPRIGQIVRRLAG